MINQQGHKELLTAVKHCDTLVERIQDIDYKEFVARQHINEGRKPICTIHSSKGNLCHPVKVTRLADFWPG